MNQRRGKPCHVEIGLPLLVVMAALLEIGCGWSQIGKSTQTGACTVGVSAVACLSSTRTIVVAQDGSGQYTSIQPALSAAQAGDTIEVKNGTYSEALAITNSGEPNRPIMLVNYPGTNPLIAPPCTASGQTVNLIGSWLVLSGFEITTGWDGIDVYGSNNLVTNNYIHDTCGQGVLVISAHDVAITGNRIASNGLLNPSNCHFHGIYFSDFYLKGMYNLSVIGNSFSNSAGAGIQSWDPSARKRNLLIENNTFTNDSFEIIFTNTDSTTVRGNTFVHDSYPATSFAQSAILWLEADTNISFSNNKFQYGITEPATGSTANYIVYTNQPNTGVTFAADTWSVPAGFPTTNDAIVAALFAQ